MFEIIIDENREDEKKFLSRGQETGGKETRRQGSDPCLLVSSVSFVSFQVEEQAIDGVLEGLRDGGAILVCIEESQILVRKCFERITGWRSHLELYKGVENI